MTCARPSKRASRLDPSGCWRNPAARAGTGCEIQMSELFGRCEDCPPKLGGQPGREATTRGVVPWPDCCGFGTTPALRATPPDSGGELPSPPIHSHLHRPRLQLYCLPHHFIHIFIDRACSYIAFPTISFTSSQTPPAAISPSPPFHSPLHRPRLHLYCLPHHFIHIFTDPACSYIAFPTIS